MLSLQLFIVLGLTLGLAWTASVPEADDPVDHADRSIVLPGNLSGAYGQPSCLWQVNNNPCVNNVLQRMNFPHPHDNSKFIQCGLYDRIFIIQCPPGEVYDQATTTCVKSQVVVSKPILDLTSVGLSNPCTQQNVLSGRIFFSVAGGDNTRFIQCDANCDARLLTCPAKMLWDQSRQSCIYATQAGVVLQVGAIGTGAGTPGLLSTSNPCTLQALSANALFFAHPDPTKFIQCDLQGNAFVQQCPSGLVWSQYLETCASKVTSLTATAGQQQMYAAGTLLNTGGYVMRG